MKLESKFSEPCVASCPCHKTITHNACLECLALRNSPYHKGEFENKSDEDIEKMQTKIEAEWGWEDRE